MNFHTTESSMNKKTGRIAVVTASRDTCPSSCPLKNNGCYAEHGPLAIHWNAVSEGRKGGDLDEALKPIRQLPKNEVWRYGQAGDLPGDGDVIDREGLRKIAAANRGKRGIVFTHKPPTEHNLEALREAREAGLNVNLSADDLIEADELSKTGLSVVTVLHSSYGRRRSKGEWAESLSDYKKRTRSYPKETPEGRRIAVCPATYFDIDCRRCGMCSQHDRKEAIIGFPAHGTKTRAIDEQREAPGVRREREGSSVADDTGPPS